MAITLMTIEQFNNLLIAESATLTTQQVIGGETFTVPLIKGTVQSNGTDVLVDIDPALTPTEVLMIENMVNNWVSNNPSPDPVPIDPSSLEENGYYGQFGITGNINISYNDLEEVTNFVQYRGNLLLDNTSGKPKVNSTGFYHVHAKVLFDIPDNESSTGAKLTIAIGSSTQTTKETSIPLDDYRSPAGHIFAEGSRYMLLNSFDEVWLYVGQRYRTGSSLNVTEMELTVVKII